MASEVVEHETGYYSPYMSEYKKRSWKIDQESRRNVLLEEQKRRREESYDAFRDFSEIFSFSEDSNFDDVDEDSELFCEERKTEASEKPKFPKLKSLFMFSEWMTELPDDFAEKWVLVPCPVGKRCLVKSFKGSTSAYNTGGYQTARYKSALPNGGCHSHSTSKYQKSEMTILDCIWNGTVQKYFVLDVLYWKNQSFLDTDIGFRNFWIKSKIEEMPWLSEKSKTNPYPFVALNSYPCDYISLSSILSKFPYFESDSPPIDGLLFYHKEGYYTRGINPLVLWLKPFMICEILGEEVHIADEYVRSMPANYTNRFDYITRFEEMRKRKINAKCRRNKGARAAEEMEVCTPESDVFEVD